MDVGRFGCKWMQMLVLMDVGRCGCWWMWMLMLVDVGMLVDMDVVR